MQYTFIYRSKPLTNQNNGNFPAVADVCFSFKEFKTINKYVCLVTMADIQLVKVLFNNL